MTFKQKDLDKVHLILEGIFFKYIKEDGLYLSSNSAFFNLCTLDLYNNIRLVSAYNPPFEGVSYKNYTIINDNKISINLNSSLPLGHYDIIFCNPAGYVKGSNKTNKPVFRIVD